MTALFGQQESLFEEPAKQCLDCGARKPLDDFPPAAKRSDGRGSYCRSCMRARSKASYRKRAAAQGRSVREPRTLPAGYRWCPDCAAIKSLDDFARNAAGRGGRHSYCKPCGAIRSAASLVKTHGSSRDYHLRRRYGLTSADVEAMVAEQGGLCALCRRREPQHVDHDHVTGKVRGVLCSGCNQGLGNFSDDAAALRAAADYLERTTWQKRQVCTGVFRLTSPRPAPAPSRSSSELRHLISSRRG